MIASRLSVKTSRVADTAAAAAMQSEARSSVKLKLINASLKRMGQCIFTGVL
jgi:hypothetical protein